MTPPMDEPQTRMTADTWNALVKRFANGRSICNCGQAYYALDGEAWVGGEKITNHPHCKYGCSANQYAVKDEIARAVFAELRASRTSVEPPRERANDFIWTPAWLQAKTADQQRELLAALLTSVRSQAIEMCAGVADGFAGKTAPAIAASIRSLK